MGPARASQKKHGLAITAGSGEFESVDDTLDPPRRDRHFCVGSSRNKSHGNVRTVRTFTVSSIRRLLQCSCYKRFPLRFDRYLPIRIMRRSPPNFGQRRSPERFLPVCCCKPPFGLSLTKKSKKSSVSVCHCYEERMRNEGETRNTGTQQRRNAATQERSNAGTKKR
jgi:hypothetical protein